MDLFYHSLPNKRKLRLYFYNFMINLHKQMFCL
ncbi:cell division protein ZapE [Blochmannia endosymbiont of Colobopsis nipponica]|nr:cell division protein ZapE [Blochmannia endosymbiont of Colobopsis nipponica]